MVTSPFMQKALDLAEQALRITSPNPRVGCVIVSAQGHVVGQGHTQRAGGPHAEIVALQDAASRNLSVEGATVYVTLEPCAHHGKTGPCCDALIKAKVAKVVIAMVDPNPLVAGKSIDRLKAAQIEVELGDGAAASAALNPGFLSRMTRQKPWVRMKIAASLDGQTALQNGQSQWITGPEARLAGHRLRAEHDAILVGVGTVLADDPELTVRVPGAQGEPLRVVLDSNLRTPPNAKMLGERALVLSARAGELAGTEVVAVERDASGLSVTAALRVLAARGVRRVLVEGGGAMHRSFLEAGVVDRLELFMNGRVLAGGPGFVAGPGFSLGGAPGFVLDRVSREGADLWMGWESAPR